MRSRLGLLARDHLWTALPAAALFAILAALAARGGAAVSTAAIVAVALALAAALLAEVGPVPVSLRPALRVLVALGLAAAALVAGLGDGAGDLALWLGAGAATLVFVAALLLPAGTAARPGPAAGRTAPAALRVRTRIPRWIAAGCLLVAVALLILISHLGSSLRSCEDALATVGDHALVEDCRPLALGDLLPLLLLAALLLLPDLSTIKITGLGEIRMRQDEQEERLGRTEGSVSTVRTGLVGVLLDATSEEAMAVKEKELEELQSEAETGARPGAARVLREGAEEAPPGAAPARGRPGAGERGEAVAELDLEWSRLRAPVRLGERCVDPTFLSRAVVFAGEPPASRSFLLSGEEAEMIAAVGDPGPEDLRKLSIWASLFEEEIATVRLVEEAAHDAAAPTGTEAIRQASAVARRLEGLLPEGIHARGGTEPSS